MQANETESIQAKRKAEKPEAEKSQTIEQTKKIETIAAQADENVNINLIILNYSRLDYNLNF